MQMTRGDLDAARGSLQILRARAPSTPGLLKMEAAVALRDADLAGAASLLQEHLQANPGDAEAWLTLSEIQVKLGNFEASEESRRKGQGAEGG
jgi:cytochrome c-type biogenesis protein CcmH/NrfG